MVFLQYGLNGEKLAVFSKEKLSLSWEWRSRVKRASDLKPMLRLGHQ